MKITRSTFLRIGLAAIAGLAVAPATALAQGRKKYVFATEGAFPPFNMTRPNGELYGFELDMLAEIAKRADFDYEVISQAWDGMIQGLIDGKYNAVVDSVSVTEKRLEVVDFSLPYTTGGSTFVVLKESGVELPGTGAFVDLDDKKATDAAIAAIAGVLDGKTVGVHVSTIQADFLNKYLADKGVTIRTYQTGPEVYQDLLNGRLDAGIASVTNISAFLEKNTETAKATGPSFTGGVMGRGSAFVVQKGDAELAGLLSKALKSMSDDGTLVELSKKWFGMVVTPTL
ncbi:MAG: transporter substrate-binding domain-containing protein [Mesorhizobium sp.]|uniref:transporter substrate-binding domain-containing protein n=1 Tax=Mesorhizobium sp. TaxID=1871066 RepID=UPI000FE641E1|nr:transporter substrate-binding domain-containing protein [Mesorhizobium sp.]RWQ37271.1 MAG: transporter substrate-binding domain-containing protein [Mesorhizobium sp.]RWQ68042.1 MAG: transporter substrate-binding domain-containing protein [Mesorhizobium sp.]TIL26654.1 MAG: transporter substrate-binding domain-containing protein [Mesorhizobium sp.]